MRPSLFHHHGVRTFPGEDDVHGEFPQPRSQGFDRQYLTKTILVAYVSDEDTEFMKTVQLDAATMDAFGEISQRPRLEFIRVAKGHWIYNSVPQFEEGAEPVVFWIKMPPKHYVFPWLPGAEISLFDRNTLDFAVTIELKSYNVAARRRTGYAVGIVLERANCRR